MPLAAEPSGSASRLSAGPSPGTARQAPAGPSRARPLRDRNRRRVHMRSPRVGPAFFGDGALIALDRVIVLGHELLVVEIGVHLSPQRFGQMAPDFLVKVGGAVRLAFLAASPGTGLFAVIARAIIL